MQIRSGSGSGLRQMQMPRCAPSQLHLDLRRIGNHAPRQVAKPGAQLRNLIPGHIAQQLQRVGPQIGQHPDQLSPHLDKTLADKLLADAKAAIYGTFGILPGLMNPATTGPMVREAQRHLAQLVLQPIANQLAEEASEKIGQAVKIDCVRPMQAYDHGGKARAFATMLGALAEAKAAGLDVATIKDAESFIDWQD